MYNPKKIYTLTKYRLGLVDYSITATVSFCLLVPRHGDKTNDYN
jgi:hypothetical protein